MKIAADEKKRKGLIQQALHEYGQLLKHPYMFGKSFVCFHRRMDISCDDLRSPIILCR